MNRYRIVLLTFLLFNNIDTGLYAQIVNEGIMKPINLFFEGMEKVETSLLKNIFAKMLF